MLLAKEQRADDPVGVHVLYEGRQRVAWKAFIGYGCARVFGARGYTSGGNFMVIGRQADVRSAVYLYGLIIRQVDEFADRGWEIWKRRTSESARAWKNGFRYGCARTVRERLTQEAKEREQKLAIDPGMCSALAIFDRRKDAIARIAERVGLRDQRFGSPQAADAYLQGRAAGRHVNFGNKASGSLGSGQRSITG
jgi:hypothetical protein